MLKYSKEIVLNLQGSGLRAASPLSVSCSACVFLIHLGTQKDDTNPLSIEHAATDGFHCHGIGNTKQTKCLIR